MVLSSGGYHHRFGDKAEKNGNAEIAKAPTM